MEWNLGEQVAEKGEMPISLEERRTVIRINLEKCVLIMLDTSVW